MTTSAQLTPFNRTAVSSTEDRLAMSSVDLAYCDLIVTIMSGIGEQEAYEPSFEMELAQAA